MQSTKYEPPGGWSFTIFHSVSLTVSPQLPIVPNFLFITCISVIDCRDFVVVVNLRCQFLWIFTNFYRATLMHSAYYAVARCLSVRPSHAGIVSKRLYISSKFFQHRV